MIPKCEKSCTENFLLIVKITTTILSLISTYLILKLSLNHMKNYSNSLMQKKIIVITFIIPFYSLNAMITSLFVHEKNMSEVLAIIRAMYEAVLVMSFFHLVVAYVCYKPNVSKFQFLNFFC